MIVHELRKEFNDSVIFYDGDCIYCQKYTELLKLRQNIGPVQLVNLRERADVAKLFSANRMDVDEGMAFLYGTSLHYGAEAVHVLATASEPDGLLNRLNRFVFRSQSLSRVLYPVLKLGRRATLILRGKKLIKNDIADRL